MTITSEDALALHGVGLAVYPPMENGTKAPAGKWRQYEHEPPTAETVTNWYRNGRDGIGVITGASSGNLEMLELEGGAIREGMLEAFYARATEWGLEELIWRVCSAYMEESPSGGVHFFFRVDGPAKANIKLARRPLGLDDNGRPLVETLIETRGQGGFAIIAPSGGKVHGTGASYEVLAGDLAVIVTITEAERDSIHKLAASFDEMPEPEPPKPPPAKSIPWPTTSQAGWFDQVVDDYNARTTWDMVLVGWTFDGDRSGVGYWVRPGKDRKLGHSATTNALGTDRLTVFSSSVADFEVYDGVNLTTTYDRFSATSILQYDGDRIEAARALRAAGYGPPERSPDTATISDPGPAQEATTDSGWPALHPDAMHGPIGAYAKASAPYTEADPVAVLTQLLAGVGCIANSGPHVHAGNDRHPAALFVAIVGATAKGKKGTSWAAARIVLDRIDHDFTKDRILGGFGSGEILIETVANGTADDDENTKDTRTLWHEGELGQVLTSAGRENSILGHTLRNGWDGKTLSARTRGKGSAVAHDYHLSMVGHITLQELRASLSSKDTFGGTTNRFLWVAAKRARRLPDGGNIPEHLAITAAETLTANIAQARRHTVYQRTPEAVKRWHELYDIMGDDDPEGLLGAAIARAESQVTRLSLAYAIADGASDIGLVHINAAWALWLYCRATAAMIFPPTTTLAEHLLGIITDAGEPGLTKTAIHAFLGRNTAGRAIDEALAGMIEDGLIVEMKGPSGAKGGRRPTLVKLAQWGDDHDA